MSYRPIPLGLSMSITSAVCSFYPRFCLLGPDRGSSPQGWRTFNITLNHPPSRFLRRPSALRGTIVPLGPGKLTHNIAGIPIVIACTKTIDDDTNLFGPGTSRLGGMVKGKGDKWEEHANGSRYASLKCASHFPFSLSRFSFSQHCRRGKPLHTTPQRTTLNILH